MTVCAHKWEMCGVLHYERCRACGSYHSTAAVPTAELYTADYWDGHPNRSSMADQVYNVETHKEDGRTKDDFVLGLVVPPGPAAAALEIGCAPGVLLRRLHAEAGFALVLGIEYREEFAAAVRKIAGPDVGVWFGEFPSVTAALASGTFGLIVGLDVFEHVHEPEAFLRECARLLKPGGQVLLMLPVAHAPEQMEPRMFCPAEHVFMPSALWMTEALSRLGFGNLAWDAWCRGHETVTAWKEAA